MARPKQEFLPVDPIDAAAIAGTRLESVEEIRKAVQVGRKPTEKESQADTDTLDFRPVHRAPMAMLCILDDGRNEGEWIRLRQDVTVIGRTEGDIKIPHDGSMSSRHLAITRTAEKGRYRWHLSDLDSTNGIFVRVSKAILRHGQEIMIGGGRFRFEAGGAVPAKVQDADVPETRAWQNVQPTDLLSSLVELAIQGTGQRHFLKTGDTWIGRDLSQCAVAQVNDLMASPRHARIFQDEKRVWYIENAGSRNGTWVRLKRMPVDNFAQFQVGEQRFLLKIL
ncbi:MAG TPA: FHA domain-containing protein [Gemmataceae bacterium]|nr:FHA domain-containing protein [Gemmataceae bacterium]